MQKISFTPSVATSWFRKMCFDEFSIQISAILILLRVLNQDHQLLVVFVVSCTIMILLTSSPPPLTKPFSKKYLSQGETLPKRASQKPKLASKVGKLLKKT